MNKVISSLNVTLDGFCGHESVVADEEHHEFVTDLLRHADVVLLGRVTYQLFENYWPNAVRDTFLSRPVHDFAVLIDQVNKVVISTTLKETRWRNSVILNQLDRESIGRLKLQAKQNILIFGSPGLVSQLTQLKLVDEYYFSIQPILEGRGKRLFESTLMNEQQNLHWIDKKVYHSGVVTLRYQR